MQFSRPAATGSSAFADDDNGAGSSTRERTAHHRKRLNRCPAQPHQQRHKPRRELAVDATPVDAVGMRLFARLPASGWIEAELAQGAGECPLILDQRHSLGAPVVMVAIPVAVVVDDRDPQCQGPTDGRRDRRGKNVRQRHELLGRSAEDMAAGGLERLEFLGIKSRMGAQHDVDGARQRGKGPQPAVHELRE